MKTLIVNNIKFTIERRTKHTLDAFAVDGIKVTSGPSIPKIEAKLEKLFPLKEKPKGTSIKSVTLGMIVDGKEDKEIVATVQEAFPKSAFNNNHISWYRSTLFRDKIIGPEHAPRRSKAYKDWKNLSLNRKKVI